MILPQIEEELKRLEATDAKVTLDEEFDPDVGQLARLEFDDADWHLFPDRLLDLLKGLPRGAGQDAIRQTIEQNEMLVWHGPAPTSRDDTSPSP